MNKRTISIIAVAAGGILVLGGGAAFAASAAPVAHAASTSSATPTSDGTTAVGGDLEGAIAAALAAAGPGVVLDADTDDDSTHAYEVDIRLDAGGTVEVRLAADLSVVSIQPDDGDDDSDRDDDGRDDDLVTDAGALKSASEAALAFVGSGTVTKVEFSDDADHVYEVEIDLGDGEDIDVELAADFSVVKAD